jgi:uncharacterized membrane protein
MTILLGFFVAAGLLLSALSLPLIWHKVPPNPLYGFRVRQTLDDPAVWYPVNAFAAKGLLGVGLATCAAAVGLYLLPDIDLAVYATAVAGVALTCLAINVFLSFRYLVQVQATLFFAGALALTLISCLRCSTCAQP